MNTITFVVSSLALAAWGTVAMVNNPEPAASLAPNPYAVESPPVIPATPAVVDGLVYARKFTLEKGYKFRWCEEKPIVKSGYLLVLKVNPDLVFPRQCAQPVLFVGEQTAQPLNHGYPSGHVIAIAPGDPDLSKALIWFGTPRLAEGVNATTVQAELDLAKNAGIKPLSAKALEAARAQAGEDLKGSTFVDVLRMAADLIRQYSPEEKQLAETCVPEPPKPAPDPEPD